MRASLDSFRRVLCVGTYEQPSFNVEPSFYHRPTTAAAAAAAESRFIRGYRNYRERVIKSDVFHLADRRKLKKNLYSVIAPRALAAVLRREDRRFRWR